MLNNTAGNPILKMTGRNHYFFYYYDELQRKIRTLLFDESDPLDVDTKIIERITYGTDPLTNSIGQIAKICAQDGKTTFEYDFKGNIILSRKQFSTDYDMIPSWDENDEIDVDLQTEQFVTQTFYNALNRPITILHPDDTEV